MTFSITLWFHKVEGVTFSITLWFHKVEGVTFSIILWFHKVGGVTFSIILLKNHHFVCPENEVFKYFLGMSLPFIGPGGHGFYLVFIIQSHNIVSSIFRWTIRMINEVRRAFSLWQPPMGAGMSY